MQRVGELVAFGTAICWTVGALFFEHAVKRIGSLAVNFFKLSIAFVLLTITAAVMRGMPLPLDASRNAWLYLALSGIVGFVITDLFLFTAYGTVGPRIAMLFMALSPPVTAGLAFLFLGEALGHRAILGMCLVILGICMTIFGKQNGFEFAKIKKEDRKGYLFALIACLGQSIGMNLTKIGVEGYNSVSGTQIRVMFGIAGFALTAFFFDRGKGIRSAAKNTTAMKFTAAGAVFGPFLGVTLSLVAIQRVSAGIVSTLIGLTPILILVPEILLLKKKIKFVEIAGAVIAVCGTAIFFL